jgi:TonB family protein
MPRRSSLAAAAALSGAVFAAATARAADTPAHIVRPPDGAVMIDAWSALGKTPPQQGRAVVRCQVSAAGAVSDCGLVRETPSALGLGQLLLAVAPKYQVAPAAHDGRAVDSTILIERNWYRFDKASDWLRKPTAGELLSVFPREALIRGRSGEATIGCLVSTQGALFDCYVVSESPDGNSFGDAALALTPQFLMRPATLNGQPVVSTVRIPINFRTVGAGLPLANSRKLAPPAALWVAAPSYAEVAAAYPGKAKAAKIGGRATLYCQFTASGGLTDCQTVAEEPRRQGFATAAHKLAHEFRLGVTGPEDVKALREAAVQLPVTFDPAMIGGGPPVIGKPLWAATPGPDDVTAAFAATPKNVGTVRVSLACKVEQGGWTSGCSVERESPAGQGFGQAALALSPKFRVGTWTSEGLPVVGGVISVPLRYESGPPAKP